MGQAMKKIAGLALGLFLGCGGDDGGGGSAKDIKALTGVWTYASGNTTLKCAGAADLTYPLTGSSFTFAPGTDSDLVATTVSGCAIKFDVAGKVASVRAGQSCEFSPGATTAMTSWTVTSDGLVTAQTSLTGTTSGNQGGLTYSCPTTASGTLSRPSVP